MCRCPAASTSHIFLLMGRCEQSRETRQPSALPLHTLHSFCARSFPSIPATQNAGESSMGAEGLDVF